MISDVYRRKLALVDRSRQAGHRELMNLRHVTKW
jgi:hypothetical protein